MGEIGLVVEKLDGDTGLSVTVKNGIGSSLLFNAANIAGQFSIRSGTKMIQVSIDKTTQVAPGEQDVFVLTAAEELGQEAVLVCALGNYRVFIGL